MIGLPRWRRGKESACQCRRCGFDPCIRKIPWRRKWQPLPIFLPGKIRGQRSLTGYSPKGHKESDRAECARTHAHTHTHTNTHTKGKKRRKVRKK